MTPSDRAIGLAAYATLGVLAGCALTVAGTVCWAVVRAVKA